MARVDTTVCKSRSDELAKLAKDTLNQSIMFIYDGGYTDEEIEIVLTVRASYNVSRRD